MPHMSFTSSQQTLGSPISSTPPNEIVRTFQDSRSHGYQGPTRSVTIPNVTSSGNGAISSNRAGDRCVVVGRESIRILRLSPDGESTAPEHRFAIGEGGCRIEASKNLCSNMVHKIDSALSDVAWCQGSYDNKVLTSARNGELIMWDLQKHGPSKIEKRFKAHPRSINKLSYCHAMPHYFTTASSDGYLRLWDLRDLQKSTTLFHHLSPVRSSVFSQSPGTPFHAATGLDNGNICRWDLRSSSRSPLDWISFAHNGAVLSLDWRSPSHSVDTWIASAGLDRLVKVWDYPAVMEAGQSSAVNPNHSRSPIYTLHASFPVRRVAWRPGYETELAIASNNETGYKSFSSSSSTGSSPHSTKEGADGVSMKSASSASSIVPSKSRSRTSTAESDIAMRTEGNITTSGDMIEIWDVRRAWIAKWTMSGSNREGGVADMLFADSHALWVQHPSGAFSQMDLRFCEKPIESIPRSAVTWNPTDSLTFAADRNYKWEVPYDDIALEASTERNQVPHKRLGDGQITSMSQVVGTLSGLCDAGGRNAFVRLAAGYTLEGANRTDVCNTNAEIAFDAEQDDTGRIWLLLGTLLTDVVHQSKQSTPRKALLHPTLLHSTSAPAGVPSIKRSPPQKVPPRSSSSEAPMTPLPYAPQKVSPLRNEDDVSGRNLSSTIHTSSPLSLRPPPSSLSFSVQGSSSFSGIDGPMSPGRTKVRNQSVSAAYPTRPRRHSLRRISLSSIPILDEIPRQSNMTLTKPRRSVPIGEGALDDSSSSGEEVLSNIQHAREPSNVAARESLTASSSHTHKKLVSSPLTRDGNWSEDERDEDSASPRSSSDTDSDVSKASTKPVKEYPTRPSGRSRSSTLVSMAPSYQSQRPTGKHDLHRTSRTTVLGDNRHSDIDARKQTLSSTSDAEYFVGDDGRQSTASKQTKKRRSQAFSLNIGKDYADSHAGRSEGSEMDMQELHFLNHYEREIRIAEIDYRRAAWKGLKDAFQNLMSKGDVQTCAMLSCIASVELGISLFAALTLVESYIDLLTRMRLHSAAAYVRKFSSFPEIRETSKVQTTVYSSCQKCLKPIDKYTRALSRFTGLPRTGYSYCSHCKRDNVKCAICRLPVRTALFMCSVCSHGGHQDCYRRYYLERPMVDVSQLIATPKRAQVSESEGKSEDARGVAFPDARQREVLGHTCVTGCGHVCWSVE